MVPFVPEGDRTSVTHFGVLVVRNALPTSSFTRKGCAVDVLCFRFGNKNWALANGGNGRNAVHILVVNGMNQKGVVKRHRKTKKFSSKSTKGSCSSRFRCTLVVSL